MALPTEWPVCEAMFEVEGFSLTCDRPKGHDMDGEKMHRDPLEGVEWMLTADG